MLDGAQTTNVQPTILGGIRVEEVSHMLNMEENTADLKDIMTTPPMTAERHAAITRKKIEQRRLAEDTRDAERYCTDDFAHMRTV